MFRTIGSRFFEDHGYKVYSTYQLESTPMRRINGQARVVRSAPISRSNACLNYQQDQIRQYGFVNKVDQHWQNSATTSSTAAAISAPNRYFSVSPLAHRPSSNRLIANPLSYSGMTSCAATRSSNHQYYLPVASTSFNRFRAPEIPICIPEAVVLSAPGAQANANNRYFPVSPLAHRFSSNRPIVNPLSYSGTSSCAATRTSNHQYRLPVESASFNRFREPEISAPGAQANANNRHFPVSPLAHRFSSNRPIVNPLSYSGTSSCAATRTSNHQYRLPVESTSCNRFREPEISAPGAQVNANNRHFPVSPLAHRPSSHRLIANPLFYSSMSSHAATRTSNSFPVVGSNTNCVPDHRTAQLQALLPLERAIEKWAPEQVRQQVFKTVCKTLSQENSEGTEALIRMLNKLLEHNQQFPKQQLRQRVVSILTALKNNPELRMIVLAAASEGGNSCVDKSIYTFTQIETWYAVNRVLNGKQDDNKMLYHIRGLVRQEKLKGIVGKVVANRAVEDHKLDETEVYLAYNIGLKDSLDLPFNTSEMHFRGIAKVSETDLAAAADELFSAEQQDPQALIDAMMQHPYWKHYLEQHYQEAHDADTKISSFQDRQEQLDRENGFRVNQIKSYHKQNYIDAKTKEELLMKQDINYQTRSNQLLQEREKQSVAWYQATSLQLIKEFLF